MIINTGNYRQYNSSLKNSLFLEYLRQFKKKKKKALLTPDKDNVSQWNEVQDDCEHTEGYNGQPA